MIQTVVDHAKTGSGGVQLAQVTAGRTGDHVNRDAIAVRAVLFRDGNDFCLGPFNCIPVDLDVFFIAWRQRLPDLFRG